MLKVSLLVGGTFSLLGMASCSKEPTAEYRLTAEQLAWQPYRTGDVLRFGQAQTSKVRTYTIAEVNDRFESRSQGGNAPVYLGPATKFNVQVVDVRAPDRYAAVHAQGHQHRRPTRFGTFYQLMLRTE